MFSSESKMKAPSRRLCVQNLINKADLILNGDPEKYLKTVTTAVNWLFCMLSENT